MDVLRIALVVCLCTLIPRWGFRRSIVVSPIQISSHPGTLRCVQCTHYTPSLTSSTLPAVVLADRLSPRRLGIPSWTLPSGQWPVVEIVDMNARMHERMNAERKKRVVRDRRSRHLIITSIALIASS